MSWLHILGPGAADRLKAAKRSAQLHKHGDHVDFTVELPAGTRHRACLPAGVDRRQARTYAHQQTEKLWRGIAEKMGAQ